MLCSFFEYFPSHHSQICACCIPKTVLCEADASCPQHTHIALKFCKWLLSSQVKQLLLWFVEVQGCTAPFRCTEEERQCEPICLATVSKQIGFPSIIEMFLLDIYFQIIFISLESRCLATPDRGKAISIFTRKSKDKI